MGVYDFFRGTCPHCKKRFDCDESGQETGDIQTKMFYDANFRDFFPGDEVPEYFGKEIYIGECSFCRSKLHAVFRIQENPNRKRELEREREEREAFPRERYHRKIMQPPAKYFLVRYIVRN